MTSFRAGTVRVLLTLSGLAALPAVAYPASFDCGAARSPIEHAICDDGELSALDSQLADAYRNALKGQGDAADQLKMAQRQWLKSRVTDGKIDPNSLKEVYRARITELKGMPVFPSPDASVEGPTFRLVKAAKQHDFVLRMLDACSAEQSNDDTTCEGPAQLLIYGKRQSKLLQTINLPNVIATLPKGGGSPLVNSARLYDDQGVLNVGDFNFDGEEDFGIQTGNEGSYGGPSYDVYLFDPKSGRFVYNDPMTGLIQQTLGFFDVDEKHKLLHTYAKSGCCYHESTSYRVDHNVPVAVERHIEDAVITGGDKMKVTDEKLINGKWRSKVHYESGLN
ncbi:lysozyme inhibitor LprI family protein [Paraburkholderia bannensis]|uniref:lysozyme inhibitor LprI family protein n=1 Tax=Paraburkholderia bannensis TaxID=765414 RepID=UPI002AC34376|nr:lysozyme inhibitor LprI family protein [Paraburkholderia bannensis]